MTRPSEWWITCFLGRDIESIFPNTTSCHSNSGKPSADITATPNCVRGWKLRWTVCTSLALLQRGALVRSCNLYLERITPRVPFCGASVRRKLKNRGSFRIVDLLSFWFRRSQRLKFSIDADVRRHASACPNCSRLCGLQASLVLVSELSRF